MACAESNAPSQPQDVVRRYEHGIFVVRHEYAYAPLDDALEHSVARYGPYKIEPVTTEMFLVRLHQEAPKGDLVNVAVLPAGQRDMDEGLIPINLPLDKCLWGYRQNAGNAKIRAGSGFIWGIPADSIYRFA